MTGVRRILRLAMLAFAFLLVAAALLLTGFTGAAMLRETLPAGGGPDETAQLVEIDDLSLHYRKWGPDDGPPVLLVHGTLAWAETWRDIAAPLGEAGYRVIAPDLPPFGYSERPADGDYSRRSQTELLTGFIEALDLRDFILVGHSFGGGATMETALSMGGPSSGTMALSNTRRAACSRERSRCGCGLLTPSRAARPLSVNGPSFYLSWCRKQHPW